MKQIGLFTLCIILILSTLGCQSEKSRAVEGAVIGGVIGAAGGGIIGHQSHHEAEGIGIGAAAGALTGAIIGSQIQKPGQGPAQTNAQNPNQMTIAQVVDLTKQGVSPSVIIDKIRLTNSKFNLAANDIQYLKQQGVSQQVIDAMQAG
jgi:uncharacterized protein YcfJ